MLSRNPSFQEAMRISRETAIGFWKEPWLKRMEKESTPRTIVVNSSSGCFVSSSFFSPTFVVKLEVLSSLFGRRCGELDKARKAHYGGAQQTGGVGGFSGGLGV